MSKNDYEYTNSLPRPGTFECGDPKRVIDAYLENRIYEIQNEIRGHLALFERAAELICSCQEILASLLSNYEGRG